MSETSRATRGADDRVQQLEADVRRLRSLLDDVDAIVWEADAHTLQFLSVSRGAERILGYPVQVWLDTPDFWAAHLAPADAADAMSFCQEATNRGEDHELEYRMIAADGRAVWLHDVVRVVRDDKGVVRWLKGVMVDVTAQKLAQEEATRRRIEAEQARKLEGLKDQLLGAVSHELRTPLTAIVGFAEFLEDDVETPLTARQSAYVDHIKRGAARLSGLVDDLLDFGRLEAGQFRLRVAEGDMVAKAREVVAELGPLARQGDLRLEVAAAPPAASLPMDGARVGQVLRNLIHNAIKFTPHGGVVEVRIHDLGGVVRVEVEDSGPGIDAPDVPKLFTRFSQLDAGTDRGGTGLGLWIARSIVEAHGGRIGVSRAGEKGGRFWLELPRPGT